MSNENIKTGWIKDKDDVKFAPKTLMSQVQDNEGKSLETTLDSVVYFDAEDNENVEAPIEGGASIDVTAEVGQTIVVKEVDINNKPTKWEAVDYQPKTHGMEYVTLVPESTVEYNEEGEMHLTATTEPLVVGADYLINFNGTVWNLPCKVIVEEGVAGKYIGTTAFPPEDGQPPFCIINVADLGMDGYLFILAETYDPITLSVERIEYEQIPTKFIPSIEEQRIHDEVVVPETTVTDYSDDVAERWFRIPYFDPIIGSSYLINIDGEEYRCVMDPSWAGNTDTREIKFLKITDSYLIETFNYLDYSRENYTCLVTTLDPQPESVTVSVTQAIEDKIPSRLIESNIDSITAKVGQTVIIKEIDANGKPTKWESADYQQRTHWKEQGQEDIVHEITFTPILNESMGIYQHNLAPFELVEGNTYTVIFDGIEYSCIAKTAVLDNMKGIFIGNGALMGENTGEPFGIATGSVMYSPDNSSDPIPLTRLYIVMSFDGNEHTVRVIENKIVSHKIPEEYVTSDFFYVSVINKYGNTLPLALATPWEHIIEAVKSGKVIFLRNSGYDYDFDQYGNLNTYYKSVSYICTNAKIGTNSLECSLEFVMTGNTSGTVGYLTIARDKNGVTTINVSED